MRRLALVFAAAAMSACSVAPIMKPNEVTGSDALQSIREQEGKGLLLPAAAAVRYRDFLRSQQTFDQPLTFYYSRFSQTLKTLEQYGTNSSYQVVPIDGLSSYYVAHAWNLANSYVFLAKDYLAEGDMIRAERAAFDALAIAEKRIAPWDRWHAAKISQSAWGVLADLYDKKGYRGAALWARSQRKLRDDYLSSADAQKARLDYENNHARDEEEFMQANLAIEQLNRQKAAEIDNQMSAAMNVIGSAAITYSQVKINAQVSRQGYATQSQTAQLQTLKFAKIGNNAMLADSAGRAGRFGRALMSLNDFAGDSGLFNQFVNPEAGTDPLAVLRDFNQKAVALKSSLSGDGATLDKMTNKLGDERKAGDAAATQDTASKMLDVLDSFASKVREVK